MYKIVYLDQVEDDLKKLDKSVVKKILSRIETYLVQDPKGLGKQLTGEFQGYWRYRWGDYHHRRPAQYSCLLCQESERASDVRRRIHLSSDERESGGRYSDYFCYFNYAFSRHDRKFFK